MFSLINQIYIFILKKLSPGREHDLDMMEPQGTQSQDCEPTPPLQRHGSKNNFFQPQMDGSADPSRQNVRMFGQARYSPHPRHRYLFLIKI